MSENVVVLVYKCGVGGGVPVINVYILYPSKSISYLFEGVPTVEIKKTEQLLK